MNMQKHRAAIDKLDAQIVKLLNRRTKHVLGIGQAKLAAGKATYQPDREQALLRRIRKLADFRSPARHPARGSRRGRVGHSYFRRLQVSTHSQICHPHQRIADLCTNAGEQELV